MSSQPGPATRSRSRRRARGEDRAARGARIQLALVSLALVGLVVRLGVQAGFASRLALLVYALVGALVVWIAASAVRGGIRSTGDRLTVRTAFRTRVYERRDVADAIVVVIDARTRLGKTWGSSGRGAIQQATVIRAHDGTCLARLPGPRPTWRGETVVDALRSMGVPVAQDVRTWSPPDLDAYAPRGSVWVARHRVWLYVIIWIGMLAFIELIAYLGNFGS